MNNGGNRILLVEDSLGDARLLKEALAEEPTCPFELVHVNRLMEGLARLGQEPFAAILLDLSLPDGSGLETVTRTRLAAPTVPIVVLTGLSDEAFAVKVVQKGAQDYLVKGQIDGHLLVRALRHAIERHRLLNERNHLEEQLRQSQKMEAIGQLAGGVAHDFNNILTVIQGHTGLLLAQLKEKPEVMESLQQVSTAAERAANLTRQLLAFSRRQILQRRTLDLNEVLENVAKMLRRLLGENITLECQYAHELPPVHADMGAIEQVIMNLAVNARDAMLHGGRLRVSTAVAEIDPAFVRHHPEAGPGRFVCLTVNDNGCGMDDKTLGRIFEPFFTTKEVGKGTGLGLSMVYGIVKQHNGWVDVESRVDLGTTFRVYLPESQPAEKGAPKHGFVLTPPRGKETVLVVEDEGPVRSLVRTVLERHGYRVFQAANGVEALEEWKRHASEIDLLLTDMVMPEGMSGRDLAERLRQQKFELKIIFTTGYSVELVSGEAPALAGLRYLQKPYHPSLLAQTVRDCLDGRV
jgi:two-component system cell cycle sensor histidine kinase/response regulator CckA